MPSKITLRPAVNDDIDTLIALSKRCFPDMAEEGVVWKPEQLAQHQKVFPEGQIVAELDGKTVGAVASLIVDMGPDPLRAHTYNGVTDGGYFYNHDPQGDTLYGADVYVDPDVRGAGAGAALYEARRDLCRRLNLRRILAGGRIHGYAENAGEMGVAEYVAGVEAGKIRDLVLSFQLREGFVVRSILENYITDPLSHDRATLIEWLNPDYEEHVEGVAGGKKVRVASVQYQMRGIDSFQQFADQVDYFMETAHDYRADFVVFPEFFSVQLLSTVERRKLPALEGIAKLAELEGEVIGMLSQMAKDYGTTIIGGSHPVRRGDKLLNVCPIIGVDGEVVLQPKLHITPAERKYWGISGGDDLQIIQTPKAKIGVLICYDIEFPETARALADLGVDIIFVPYCTDDRQGYVRVRTCAQARAIENQVYVVTAGVIGNLPSVPAMDIHYGRAGVFSPSDFEFPRDGVQAEADANVEMLLVTDLDLEDLYRNRRTGSVQPRRDRRKDLFTFEANFS